MTTNTNNTDLPERDWIVRTIPAGIVVDLSGYGVEIINVTPNDAEGALFTSMTRDSFNAPFSNDGFIVCAPGVRRAGRFRYVKFVAVPSVPTSGSVTIRVFTAPRAVWVDSDPGGKMRTRFFSRNPIGGLAINSTIAQNIVDTTFPTPTPDPFWSDEAFREEMYWYGWVVGTGGAFNVWVAVQNNPNDIAQGFQYLQKFTSHLVAPSAAVQTAIGSAVFNPNVVDFSTGINEATNTNTAACRQPIPPGNVRMCIENISGGNASYYYMIGAAAHL